MERGPPWLQWALVPSGQRDLGFLIDSHQRTSHHLATRPAVSLTVRRAGRPSVPFDEPPTAELGLLAHLEISRPIAPLRPQKARCGKPQCLSFGKSISMGRHCSDSILIAGMMMTKESAPARGAVVGREYWRTCRSLRTPYPPIRPASAKRYWDPRPQRFDVSPDASPPREWHDAHHKRPSRTLDAHGHVPLCQRLAQGLFSSQRWTSSAAMQPVPALVIAWR